MGFKGRSQLDHLYGLKAEVMLSQPATKISLKTTEPRASKWISQCIGDITIERLREGVTAAVHDWRDSMNYSMDRRIEPLVMDSQIAGLEPLAGYLKSDNDVVKIQFSPDPKPPFAEPFIARATTPPEAELAVSDAGKRIAGITEIERQGFRRWRTSRSARIIKFRPIPRRRIRAFDSGRTKRWLRSPNRSVPASAAYHAEEFGNARENYYTQGEQIRGEWHGRLAEQWGLRGEVTEEHFQRLSEGQHPLPANN